MRFLSKTLFLLLCGSAAAYGGSFPDDSIHVNPRILHQEGQLVSVRIAVGQPIRIYVLGREEAKINTNKMQLEVRRISPYPATTLKLGREKDHFIILDAVDLSRENELELTTKFKEQTESLKFKINNQLH